MPEIPPKAQLEITANQHSKRQGETLSSPEICVIPLLSAPFCPSSPSLKRAFSKSFVLAGIAFCCFCFTLPRAHAFALLGPYAPWMTTNLNYRIDLYGPYQLPLGGPMPIGEGYRWNVPVLTYGFDRSFMEYFGPAGVAAVQSAIKVINDLPSASNIVLTNYPLNSTRINYVADTQSLYDLKSITLSALLFELGLAPPSENTWTLRSWDSSVSQWGFYVYSGYYVFPSTNVPEASGVFDPNYVLARNYDPYSQQTSPYVNGVLYDFVIPSTPDYSFALIDTVVVDTSQLSSAYSAVCDNQVAFSPGGYYYTGLSRDDAGGVAYLLNQTNICVESLDEFCFPTLRNTNGLVVTAPRPGVEKISFIPHPTDSAGNFLTLSNRFADIYYTNGLPTTQTVTRVTSRPDFIFAARDFGGVYNQQSHVVGGPLPCQPQGASNWINNSTLNGSVDGMGPGNIHGPIAIAFHTPGKYVAAAGGPGDGDSVNLWNWGSFNGTTNVQIFPGNQTNLTSLTLALTVNPFNSPPSFEWDVLGHSNAVYQIDVSTNLINWDPVTSITNTNGIFIFTYPYILPTRYFRATLQ